MSISQLFPWISWNKKKNTNKQSSLSDLFLKMWNNLKLFHLRKYGPNCSLSIHFVTGIIASEDRNGKFESFVERRRRAYDFPKRISGWEAEVEYMNGTRAFFKLVENYEEVRMTLFNTWYFLSHKVKTQYMHCRFIANYILPFPFGRSCRNEQTINSPS